MPEARDYLEMAFRSIKCFADDGTINALELKKIVEIAERDSELDNNEVRVLNGVVSKIKEDEMDKDMTELLEKLKALIA